MKQLVLTLLLLLPLSFLAAQDCMPDQSYADSSAGVYPLPYDEATETGVGINECAIIGEPFSFDFTVVIGDTLNVGLFSFALDSVIVSEVQGLPVGLAYACSPSNCHFLKNTMGCAGIYGTPTAANAPGEYDLTIKGSAFVNGSPLPLPLEFPNQDLAPGKYTLHLLSNAGESCPVTSVNYLEKQVSIRTMPNPTAGYARVEIVSEIAGDFSFQVRDLLGQVVEQRRIELFTGENVIEFDGSHLSNGMYLLHLQNERGYVTRKLTIQH